MVVVFASTGGVTGAEVGIAGGSAVVGQKLLEAVFGDQAVRSLAERARADLERRVRRADGRPSGPVHSTCWTPSALDAETPEQLRRAARRVDDRAVRAATAPSD